LTISIFCATLAIDIDFLEVYLEEHSIYLFQHKIMLAKGLKIIEDLEAKDWIYITSFVFLPSNAIYHAHPVFKIRMLKNGVTKWIFIDPNGNVNQINEV
jgi:hypothetical protein